jgi:hypothetical protein
MNRLTSVLMGVAWLVTVPLLSGCGPADTGNPAPSTTTTVAATAAPSPKAAVPITISRTGGIAGVHDTVRITATGAWTSEDRLGRRTTGQLTPEQLDQLQRLAADPHVAVEAAATTGPPQCADGFQYTVTIDTAAIRFEDCAHAAEPRVAKAVVGTIQAAVPGW